MADVLQRNCKVKMSETFSYPCKPKNKYERLLKCDDILPTINYDCCLG